jgi:succinate dehydrogenase/fumarate reductase flavoprotein subunit
MSIVKLETDVLVVGGGAAGLRAALAAAEAGSRVLLVNKGPVARSGITLTAAGGMQAPLHPDDNSEQFLADTLRCGYELADQSLAWTLATEAAGEVREMERHGVKFVRDERGELALGRFPGQSHPRNIFVKGGGVGLAAALHTACKRQGNIRILDDFFVTGLIHAAPPDERTVAGVMGINLRSGEQTMIRARSVVLATGGCQQLWAVNDCPSDAVGDGIIHAYRAGAELVDMEMVLFYPSVIVWPPSLKGAFVHYEFLAEAILDGNVYDKNGRTVLPKPLPVRDQAMLLMHRAIEEGRGGEHGGLYWYVGDSAKGIDAVRKKLDLAQYNYLKAHGVDPATDRIEVAPGAHYLMGGIAIDSSCGTGVFGLFATPECAGNVDGANRLAGSGIAATQVFGARAGRAASRWASEHGLPEPAVSSLSEETERICCRLTSTESSVTRTTVAELPLLRRRLQESVQRHAGVSRNQRGLGLLHEEVRQLRSALEGKQVVDRKIFNQALLDLLQLETLCEVAELVAGSALLREESRGHHYRSDFPEANERWLCHTSVVRDGEAARFAPKPL